MNVATSVITPELIAKLRHALDEKQVAEFLTEAASAASVTGDEALMVQVLLPRMQRLKLSPIVEDFLPGRPNIYGVRNGNTQGPKLAFLGHTDVVHARGWQEHWKGKPQQDPFKPAIIDGEMWGRGVADLKAGICASLMALDLIDRVGIKLNGQLSFAFVGDEESGEPGSGVSAGIKDYVNAVRQKRLSAPDFAVYVEPSKLSIYPVQMGFFIADITLVGKSAYFGKPELGVDALRAAHNVLSSIWAHSDDIAQRSEHPLLGRAFALVTRIEAGGLIAVPGDCKLSLIRKLLPGEQIDEATADLEKTVRAAVPEGVTVSFSYPAGRDHPRGGSPAGTDLNSETIALLASSVKAIREDTGNIEGAPFWSEMPFLTNGIKCPAVYFAPGDISICHTNFERVALRDYFDAILALAIFIISFCGIANGGEPN
jgi:acetylornithine deacetylase